MTRLVHRAFLVALLGTSVAIATTATAAAQARDPDTRVERRLLHAQSGGVLRELSRWSDDHWDVQQGGAWTALPAELIVSATSEAEVLTEWRQRKSAVGKLDDEARVALADWGLGQGLYPESLAQLDEVLERDPDQAAARALLARPDLPIRAPASAAPLDFAASAPPALRELTLQRVVAQAEEADAAQLGELRADLGRRLLERQPGNRAMAALALRRLAAGAEPPVSGYSQDELQELLRRSVRDVSPQVRRQAALALRDAQEEGLLLPLFKALGSSSSAIRTHAAQAMGVMQQPRAVEPLVVRLLTLQRTSSSDGGFPAARSNIFVGRQIAFVQGFDVEVAQNAAIGAPQIGTLQDGASLDVSVLGVSGGGSGGYGYLQEGEALCKALEQLTGAQPGRTKADWQRWWNEHGAEWSAAH